MLLCLDIFKTEADGQLLWRGAVESVAAAKARVRELEMASPGEYIILDQNTGHRTLLGISKRERQNAESCNAPGDKQ